MTGNFRSFDENGQMIRTGRSGEGRRGVVSAGRAEAAAIGRDILRQGGNAIDAAVAVAFALGVCEPNASGIGGGGFMLLRDGKTGRCVFLDFREKAPAAARPEMYTPARPGSNEDISLRNVYGGMAVAVVCGLILKRFAFKGNSVPFVMELPVYRFPSLKSVLMRHFLRNHLHP